MEYSLNTAASSIPMAFSASTKIPVLPKITTKEKYNGRPAKFDTIFSRDRMRPWPFCPSSFIEYAIRKDRIMEKVRETVARPVPAAVPGLYDKRFEHDNCGIGAVVDIKGRKTHQTVDDALKIVEKLEHRAGKDAAGETGDGVGLLLQVPTG